MDKIPCDPMIGADIEFFAKNKKTRDIIPCVGIIPGTKENPWSADDWQEGYALQEDNVMVEVNIPPQQSPGAFVTAVNTVKQYAQSELANRLDPRIRPSVTFAKRVVHHFTAAQLDNPQAQLIGCDPDFDAYEGGNIRIPPKSVTNSRSCGGHVHLGGDFKCPDFVAALFTELAVAAYLPPSYMDTSERTEFYGAPGIFRPKEYGIEYRTPSNLWATDQDVMWAMGAATLHTARYLTQTDAAVLHKTFNDIEWDQVNDYVRNPTDKKFHTIREVANRAGALVL